MSERIQELKQKLQQIMKRPPELGASSYSNASKEQREKYHKSYHEWELERDAVIDEITNIYKNMNEKDFTDKEGWRYYSGAQRSKQSQDDVYGHYGRQRTGWWDEDRKVWEKHGKPLEYFTFEYESGDKYCSITCSYCGKSLAMWYGSPDLSACDVCCFECFEERSG